MIFESHVNALLFALSKLYQHCIAHVNTLGVSLDKAYTEDNWRRILPISEVLIACKNTYHHKGQARGVVGESRLIYWSL